MKMIILAALTALSLAACSGPTISGQNDTAQLSQGEAHVMPVGPYGPV